MPPNFPSCHTDYADRDVAVDSDSAILWLGGSAATDVSSTFSIFGHVPSLTILQLLQPWCFSCNPLLLLSAKPDPSFVASFSIQSKPVLSPPPSVQRSALVHIDDEQAPSQHEMETCPLTGSYSITRLQDRSGAPSNLIAGLSSLFRCISRLAGSCPGTKMLKV
ncbi:hypothetical protein B0H17DRAFT_1128479 [Mycena rosella]|uniref:Uncharacterized protein n=1 Tax=Mycena rosella TaxID=1033263 RepID=A0AAD7GPH7_MYCRO|nr:hypothetical protein B0H17DRAFT_1128479 [Mycena rosella]